MGSEEKEVVTTNENNESFRSPLVYVQILGHLKAEALRKHVLMAYSLHVILQNVENMLKRWLVENEFSVVGLFL